jgi:hypothetical protein
MIDSAQARTRVQYPLDRISGLPLIITDVQAFDDGWASSTTPGIIRRPVTSVALAGNAPILNGLLTASGL